MSLLVVDVKFGVIRIRSHQEVSWDPFVIVKAINLVRRQRQSVPDGKIEKGPPRSMVDLEECYGLRLTLQESA